MWGLNSTSSDQWVIRMQNRSVRSTRGSHKSNQQHLGFECGNLKDCGTCLEFTPTCRWCISGYDVPTCESQTNPSSPCKAWFGAAPRECPASGRRLKQAFSGDGPI